ncbi:hypothetical protein K439DRAFT_1625542 [Ramaria rubella]|nr:hypothetical protein K439DRAFT_1625542 [Ramaria rubella]
MPPHSTPPANDSKAINTTLEAGNTATQAPDNPSLVNIEVQIANLLVAKSRILASRPTPPVLPSLFAMEEVIDAAKMAAVTAAAATKDDKKPILPDVVPGFKLNLLTCAHNFTLSGNRPTAPVILFLRFFPFHSLAPAIPPKAEEAFRTFRYLPYLALTTAARVKADRAKGLDRRSEKAISMVDWLAASKAAAEHTHFHWGDTRADTLSAHSSLIMELACSHGWDVAMEYDIQQREAVARNPTHNLATLDSTALTLITTRITLKPPSAFLPSHPLPALSSSALKHPAVMDPTQPTSRKWIRSEQITCFRCGLAGHLPANCKAKCMTAGKPVTAIVSGSKGEHSLIAPSGKQFCFSWARASSCSLCGNSAHGAAACRTSH